MPLFIAALLAAASAPATTTISGCTYTAPTASALFQGVTSQTLTIACPAYGRIPTTAHVVAVTLNTPGLGFYTSAGPRDNLPLQLPTEFMTANKAQIAFNANLFVNCCTYVANGETTALRGLGIGNGAQTAAPENNPDPAVPYPFAASLVIDGGAVRIMPSDLVSSAADLAVTGSHMLVEGGVNVAPAGGASVEFFGPNARTVVGLSRDGNTLWIMAVDSTASSVGLTLQQSADIMVALGAWTALNLDGGGSTTLAIDNGSGPQLLNSPHDWKSDCKVRANGGCERYVGASMAIAAPALTGKTPPRRR